MPSKHPTIKLNRKARRTLEALQRKKVRQLRRQALREDYKIMKEGGLECDCGGRMHWMGKPGEWGCNNPVHDEAEEVA